MGLLGRWNLQDASTNVDDPAANEVVGSADGVYEGTVVPMPSSGPGGLYPDAVELNGSTGRINAGVFSDAKDEYSLCVWVKETSDIYGGLVTRGSTKSAANYWAVGLGDIAAYHGGESTAIFAGSRGANWTHYVLTFDGQSLRLYRDGGIQGTEGHLSGTQSVNDPWYIGSTNGVETAGNVSYDYFDGSIAGAAIFDHPLSAAEVTEEYERGKPKFAENPRIAGTYTVGETVVAEYASTLSSDVPTYQWLREGVNISGETSASYTITTADLGQDLQVRIKLESEDEKRETIATSPAIRPSAVNEEYQPGTMDGDRLRRANGNWQVTRDAPIFVQDMAGANFNDQFDAAVQRITNYSATRTNPTTIVLPGGWLEITRPLKLVRPGAPQFNAQLFTDVHICGGSNTVIWWSDDGNDYSNLPMIEFPAARGTVLSNFKLVGRKLGLSDRVPGSIGLWVRQPFDYNVNFSALFKFEQLSFEDHMVGAYVGDAAGPDMTSARFDLCQFRNCTTGSLIEGANVDSIIYDTCRFNGVEMRRAFRTKYGRNFLFATPGTPDPNDIYYKDPWGEIVPIDWTDGDIFQGGTTAWNNRIISPDLNNPGETVTRGQQGFDPTLATNIGGASRVTVLNSNVSFNPGADRNDDGFDSEGNPEPFIEPTDYAIELEAGSITVDGLRVEGPHAGLLQVTQIPGNPNFVDNRFFTILRRCNFSDSVRPPFEIAKNVHNAGTPIIIENSHFAKNNIPGPRADDNGIIVYGGLITTKNSILHPGGVRSSQG